MIQNIGKADKIIRIIIGLILIVVSFSTSLWISLIGVIFLFTGVFGWCGLYSIFGINTCPHEITTPAPTEVMPKQETQSSEIEKQNN